MKLTVENTTKYLNDYHFQTLCLLYYPGEKFPPNIENDFNTAYFSLSCVEYDGKIFFQSKVILCAGEKTETEMFESCDCVAIPNATNEDIAAYTVGKAFLLAGKRLFGFVPPWGYLTGLRPVKRARFYLDKGYSDDDVVRLFTEGYGVDAEKALFSIDIAKRESILLRDVDDKYCALYIAIPFCPSRCNYCSFVSYSNKKLFDLLPQYIERLFEDISRTALIISDLGLHIGSIYIGGGTPSVLDNECIELLLSKIQKEFDLSHLTEFTFEAGRADCITKQKLSTIKAHGVNRISVNPQTTNDEVLLRIGRNHTVKQFYDAAECALSMGFDSVNADLIAGLPQDTDVSFKKSLNDVLSLGFDNITVHTLSVKNASPMRFNEAEIYDPEGTRVRDNVSWAAKTLYENGLYPYYLYRQKNTVGNGENTGFARKGFECLYNIVMMEEHCTVFACGASSITKLVSRKNSEIIRIAFPKYPFEYLKTEQGIGEERIKQFYNKA